MILFSGGSGVGLSFKLRAWGVMEVSASLLDVDGNKLFEMAGGHFRSFGDDGCTVEQYPGRVRVMHSNHSKLWPDWLKSATARFNRAFAEADIVPILDLEVMGPNLVRMQGIFNSGVNSCAVTGNEIVFPNEISFRGNPDGGRFCTIRDLWIRRF
ncbi:hypothetical protein [Actinocorallia sp. A-T 12471]|uniref:hypothetical protein n=1 Tax=Actinocorallia sp. A-T 12471 TaxID=3089813 RepID=UPI0029CDD522|nr:hypothetical protein [Actinocorallia sp. A-T 12471]MDX6742935.1 hypothetical protein [Actinocorallia sp. A-T 12471]